jgi:hypothetical protein
MAMGLRSGAKYAATGEKLPSLSDFVTRWFFYCACGQVWSTPADPAAERAPHQECFKCHTRVKGGL